MYAVIQTGGKQYKVTPGEEVRVEKLDGNVGDEVYFDNVLLVSKRGYYNRWEARSGKCQK